MKLSPDNYKTSWDLHAWGGVFAGLFLAVMFATGAAVVFRSQIATWQDPSAQVPTPEASYQRLVDVAKTEFDGELPARFTLRMPKGERGLARFAYFDPDRGYTEDWIDPVGGELIDKPDKLATLLYHVHTLYDSRFPNLYYVAGVISLLMVLVVITGLLIQWHNLVQQFHQFRAGERPFVRWNDMHKVLGVTSLPFQLFYAYSAVIIVLGPFFINAMAGPVFGGDKQQARSVSTGSLPAAPKPGEEAVPKSLDRLVAAARNEVPGLEVHNITVHNWGHRGGAIDVKGEVAGERFSRARVRVGQTDGKILAASTPTSQSWAAEIRRWMIETHGVAFGGVAVDILFALLSLAGAASMVTGMAVWLARRRRQREWLVDRLLERLTAGVACATLVACAAIFAGSRLWPWEMAGRWDAQELTYFLTWAPWVAAAFGVPRVRLYWRVSLGLAGALFLATPVLAGRISGAGLAGLVASADQPAISAVVGVDVGLWLVGAVLVAVGYGLGDDQRRVREEK